MAVKLAPFPVGGLSPLCYDNKPPDADADVFFEKLKRSSVFNPPLYGQAQRLSFKRASFLMMIRGVPSQESFILTELVLSFLFPLGFLFVKQT